MVGRLRSDSGMVGRLRSDSDSEPAQQKRNVDVSSSQAVRRQLIDRHLAIKRTVRRTFEIVLGDLH